MDRQIVSNEEKSVKVYKDYEKATELLQLSKKNIRQDNEKAIAYAEEAYNIATLNGDNKLIIDCMLTKARTLMFMRLYAESIEYIEKAYDLCMKSEELLLKITAIKQLGENYMLMGSHKKALEYTTSLLEQIDLIEKNQESADLIASAYSLIGNIYHDMEQYEKAIKYYEECYDIVKEYVPERAWLPLINITNDYANLKQYDKALEYGKLVLDITQKSGDDYMEAYIRNSVGKLYGEMANYEKAFESFELVINLSKNRFDDIYYNCFSYMADIYFKMGEYDKPLELINENLTYQQKTNYLKGIYNSHELLSQIYEKKDQFEQSLNHYKKYIETKEKVQSELNLKNVSALETEYNVRQIKNEAEIHRLKNVELYELTQKLEKKNESIKNLLDNVGQGFLSINSDLVIANEYSRECIKIFNRAIEGLKLTDILYPDGNKNKELYQRTLLNIFSEDDEFKQNMYLSLLPKQLQLEEIVLSVEYKPLMNKDACSVKELMVILTDITEKIVLERRAKEEEAILKMVVKTISDKKSFMNLVATYEEFCGQGIFSILDGESSSEEKLKEIYRNIHTFKGEMSIFGLVNTVPKLHNMESDLKTFMSSHKQYDKSTPHEFLNNYNMISYHRKDINTLARILGESAFKQDNLIYIEEWRIEELKAQVEKIQPVKDREELIWSINKLKYRPFKELLNQYPNYVDDLAFRLNKAIEPLVIEGGDILVDTQIYQPFTRALVHIFRNSVDHGIETDDERYEKNKEIEGQILCKISVESNSIIISIKDDGKGIDKNRILKKAIEKNIICQEEIDKIIDDEIIKLIFNDNFSTKSKITDISGRGVGMSAVKKEITKLGGNIAIKTKVDYGTEFVFTLPIIETCQ